MIRQAYVNGRYLPHRDARVSIEDRGFQFADGVYEVVTVRAGHLVDEAGHLDRLDRSLGELRIAWPVRRRALELVIRRLIARNRLRDGIVYIQVSRGAAPRDFRFPPPLTRPTLVVTTRAMALDTTPAAVSGIAVVTIPDIRWKRRDIKSTALLAQVLAKQQAVEAGAAEAWQVDEAGHVTEGASSNAWIVTAAGELVTRRPSHDILNGITRQTLMRLAAAQGLPVVERPFTVAEAMAAPEAFISSATTFATPVVRIDGRPVGSGRPGPVCLGLRQAYLAFAAGAKAG